MKIKVAIVTSLNSLRRNPMRALLTTLGIVIGIASVITMMEIGQGSSEAIKKVISGMGANSIIIFPESSMSFGVRYGAGGVKTLTPDDCKAIIKECPSVRNAAPLVYARGQVVYGSKNWSPSSIMGSNPGFLDVRDWENMSEGECFTDRDVMNANRVCVIGRTVAKELFENECPVDKEIRILNVPFKVVGVLSPKGANMMGMDQDDIIIAPWTTVKYRVSGSGQNLINQAATTSAAASTVNSTSSIYPNTAVKFYPDQSTVQIANYMMYTRFANISQIFAAAKSSEEVDSAIREITQLLRQRHHLKDGAPNDFTIRNLNEILNTLTKTTKLVTNLLLCIAMVSLLVGGVGIMNIMLVCVSERTREIGIRMAVGARQRDILRQFLTEAVILCLAGGIIGIIIGHGGSMILAGILGWPMSASPEAITLAFAVSAGVGIAFGYYPAWKASKLDPIEALRYE
ncbi:MAG: hypothetical protein A2X47_03375 [Lentisphaerae bacterium GWF2_38_69]|nr:MAG: hypothetical protein A2X47_03375 [Lentisphaerae bacterium GWF2_38_69]